LQQIEHVAFGRRFGDKPSANDVVDNWLNKYLITWHNCNLICSAKYNNFLQFWTSGATKGEYCDVEQIYSWCHNGKNVKKDELLIPWSNATILHTDRCLTLKLGKDAVFQLAQCSCNSQLSFLCEVSGLKII